MTFFSRIRRWLVAIILMAVASVIGSVGYGLIKEHRPQWLDHFHPTIKLQTYQATAVGFVDKFIEAPSDSGRFSVSGWALSKAGVSRVEVVLNGKYRIPLKTAISRPDVKQAYQNYPGSAEAGFEGKFDISKQVSNWQSIEIVVTDNMGQKTILARRTQPLPHSLETWSDLIKNRAVNHNDIFYFAMGTSNIAAGGANEIDTMFRPYESKTIKVGVRVPILYLRTTKGKAGDYVFDLDFKTSRKCGARAIAEDNLHGVIAYAVAHKLPVLFTLNGGIWSSASCDVPEWDINDELEQDVANCQWNEKNQVMPDDYLKNLSGSQESPELARALTFNIYSARNRHYKKRNLQQAAAIIREFAVQHPDLFIGVNLDPDLYINPFFGGDQWYDYNPDTLRQFREWLQGSGPYAGHAIAGVPDLSQYRRERVLTLAQVNEISGRHFKSWDEVDPPRLFPTYPKPFWEDAWATEWEHFRRHLVDLHYDELSQWVEEAGIGREFIYSSQGFMAPGPLISPFPIYINSPEKNYDTGGMSVEGAVPSNGHLGAILYGKSATNQIKMEEGGSLFSVLRKFDSGWAVVELNTADLHMPARLPEFSEDYRALREIYNYGARFISPMAWNGSRGTFAGQPGFLAYTALRDTPFEDAIKDFMISHADLPRLSRLWTFGAGEISDDDGWVPTAGTQGVIGPGEFTLRDNAKGLGSLESPDDLAFRPAGYTGIIFKVDRPEVLKTMEVDGQMADGKWITLIPPTDLAKLQRVNAGWLMPLTGVYGDTEFRRVRLNWIKTGAEPLKIMEIAFYAR